MGDSRTISGRIRNPILRGQIVDIVINNAYLFPSYLYVDGSLAQRDASISELYSRESTQDSSIPYLYDYTLDLSTRIDNFDPAQDPSISDLYDEISVLDGSLSDKVDKTTYSGTASAWINNGGSFVDVYTVDGTLGGSVLVGPSEIAVSFSDSWDQTFGFRPDKAVSFYPLEYDGVDEDWTSDAALVTKGYGNANYDQAPAIASLSDWNIAEDASIDELRNKDISQDASIVLKADKSYVDANFIPNASIGDGLFWVDGQLDVSLYIPPVLQDPSISQLFQEIENIPQDASIPYLFTYTLDLSTRLDNFDPAQDGSIVDLYNIKENKTDVDSSLADIYTYIGNLPQDGSISDLYQEIADLPQDASITDLYNVKENKTDVDSSLGDLYSYVDGSLAVQTSWNTSQDASIVGLRNTDLSQDASLGLINTNLDNVETSLGVLNNWNVSQDASLALKANISDTYTRTYIDGSLNAKQNTIPAGTYVKEASLGDGLFWVAGQLDVSVEGGGAGSTTLAALTDTSVAGRASGDYLYYNNDTSTWDNIAPLEGSLYFLQGSGNIGDVSIAGIGTAQDGSALVWVADGSFWSYGVAGGGGESALADLTDVSVAGRTDGDLLQWENDTSTWNNITPVNAGTYFYTIAQVDASFALLTDIYSKTYIDGSLNAKVNRTLFDSSILSLTNKDISQDASLGLRPLTTYVDGSLNLKANLNTSLNAVSTAYTLVAGDNNKVIEVDASLRVTLPNSLSTGFQVTIVNASTGYVTIDASTIRSKGGFKVLKDQYSGASAVHRGSGVWYVWGDLS